MAGFASTAEGATASWSRSRVIASALLLALTASSGGALAQVNRSDLAETLVGLGEKALARGDVEAARDRFERALAADPDSLAARTGLGRALLAADRAEEARALLEAALASEPEDVEALVGLAEIEERSGNPTGARVRLERALAVAPARPDIHARLEALTGPAPTLDGVATGRAVELARRHPYDPRALLAAGEARLAAGDPEGARHFLQSVLLMADRAPGSARRAIVLLQQSDAGWSERRVVWVHAWADEALRTSGSWRFQIRLLWAVLSQALDPLLGVRFVVADIGGFESGRAGAALASIQRQFSQQQQAPPAGLVAIFSGRPAPRVRDSVRLGEAEFLGRQVTVRVQSGEVSSRVLAHEVVHLFGGVHVNPEVASLMNPSGDSWVLDRWNAEILRQTRRRGFGPGGLDQNVLPRVDLGTTIAAYKQALRANLAFRRTGVLEAVESNRGSRVAARSETRKALALDPHLADVSRFVARLLLENGEPAGGILMMQTAAQLYGPATPRGRATLKLAQELERHHLH